MRQPDPPTAIPRVGSQQIHDERVRRFIGRSLVGVEGGKDVTRFHRSTQQSGALLDEVFPSADVPPRKAGLLARPVRVHGETLLARQADGHGAEPLVVAGKTLASFRPADRASLEKQQAPAHGGAEIRIRLGLTSARASGQGAQEEKRREPRYPSHVVGHHCFMVRDRYLENPVKTLSRERQLIHTLGDGRVFDERWCVMRFQTRIDDEGFRAAPMFVLDEALYAMHIV